MSSNMKYGRGKNPKSRNGFKRIYQLNEDFFGKTNEDSAYYAGFIAADGNISKNIKKLTITLQKRDQIILEEFNKKLQSTYKIRNCYSSGFPVSNLTVSSEKICLNLIKKFNITPCKSLTLKPPKIKNKKLIDCFIKGYLDGDGSVYYNEKSGLHISFLGTKEMGDWINRRFSQIVGRKIEYLYHIGDKNSFSSQFSSKTARKIFLHYYNVPNGIKRKWKEEYYNYCISWKKKNRYEK